MPKVSSGFRGSKGRGASIPRESVSGGHFGENPSIQLFPLNAKFLEVTDKSPQGPRHSFKHAMFGHIYLRQTYLRNIKVTPNIWRTDKNISGNTQGENFFRIERFLQEYVVIIM